LTSQSKGPGAQDDKVVVRVVVWSLGALLALLMLYGAIFGVARWIPSYKKADVFHQAVAALKTVEAPGESSGAVWAREGYLVFDDGWAAYRMSSSSEGWPTPDVAVLKSHNGRWYVSEFGFGNVVIRVRPDEARPASLDAYLARFPRHEGLCDRLHDGRFPVGGGV